jgi:dTDP-4-dehydrorhamnose 3,5-epimerase
MKIHHTAIQDCYLLEPSVLKDERGSFLESYNKARFENTTGLKIDFVQDNLSVSKKNVIRGLHAQVGEMEQAKLVSAAYGHVLDIAVDMRKESATYQQIVRVNLSHENRWQLFIPRGCFHGFAVLSDTATFFYKCDNFYSKDHERGIHYNDPELDIDWGIEKGAEIVSAKDSILPMMKDLKY